MFIDNFTTPYIHWQESYNLDKRIKKILKIQIKYKKWLFLTKRITVYIDKIEDWQLYLVPPEFDADKYGKKALLEVQAFVL